jgi:putative two-component system response regulator
MTEASDQMGKQTVLVVDDAPESIALLSSLLKDLYRVKVATNGEKALDIAFSSDPPDLILLDIMMPGMDGYEVCSHLKKESHTADIPVIFLTAKSEIEDEEKGFELGAVDYITKPISPPILIARVRTHLRLKKVTDYMKTKLGMADFS